MEDRFHVFKGTEVFKTQVFEYLLRFFDMKTEVLLAVGIGTDRDDLAAKLLIHL